MNKKIICTFKVVGFHNWPQAPQKVSYLKARHRHLFKFRVEHCVSTGDRDVEFHSISASAQRCLEEMYEASYIEDGYDFGDRSCETIAMELVGELRHIGYSPSAIEVWEDDEHGARVECAST